MSSAITDHLYEGVAAVFAIETFSIQIAVNKGGGGKYETVLSASVGALVQGLTASRMLHILIVSFMF